MTTMRVTTTWILTLTGLVTVPLLVFGETAGIDAIIFVAVVFLFLEKVFNR